MTVILHNFRGIKYLINTNNINSVSFFVVDSKQYADEIAEAGGSPLTRIHIDWYGGSSTSILAISEVANEFLNLFENTIEIF